MTTRPPSPYTAAEFDFLQARSLGRMATVGPDGAPHNHPVAYWFNETTGTVDIGGPALRESRKYRNLEADGRISFVVDDVADHPLNEFGQRGHGIEIRGVVDLVDDEPLMFGFTRDRIRIHARRVISWNLGGRLNQARDV
jgi:pyridoxamine 5'-phosphate oxidase family protein